MFSFLVEMGRIYYFVRELVNSSKVSVLLEVNISRRSYFIDVKHNKAAGRHFESIIEKKRRVLKKKLNPEKSVLSSFNVRILKGMYGF